MSAVVFAIAAIFGMMAAEQRVSRSNERRLLARGARMPPGDVHRVMALLYPGSFLAMGAEGAWRAWQAAPQAGPGTSPSWVASGVFLFLASKVLKYWAIRSLGDRWSFRVLVLPDVPLVTAGPYRYVRHPNYVAVVGEIAGTAMMMEAIVTGPIAILTFGALLAARIRFEERALGMAQD